MIKKILMATFFIIIAVNVPFAFAAAYNNFPALEQAFYEVPMEARRHMVPLFWLHGKDSKERLEEMVALVAEGGNGGFIVEARPHPDWLGPTWYRDVKICLDAARKHNLQLWIYDDGACVSGSAWWTCPEKYGTKQLVIDYQDIEGPKKIIEEGYNQNFVTAIAGRIVSDDNHVCVDPTHTLHTEFTYINHEGRLDGDSLIDLTPFIAKGVLDWDVPQGKWRIMKYTYKSNFMGLGTGKPHTSGYIADGASTDGVDWFLRKVYKPHYDLFKDDFGKTIAGYFYDEPAIRGEWGTNLSSGFSEKGIDEKKALTAWKFRLAGEEDLAARYAYMDTLLDVFGKGLYGGMSKWCEDRGVISIGHGNEHFYLHTQLSNHMLKYMQHSAMGALDLVHVQLTPGWRADGIYQTPKIASSVSHVYNKKDNLAFCEIFGGYWGGLGYLQMKWLADWCQVRGVNFMIPHAFDPLAPNDGDCPPYYNTLEHRPNDQWKLIFADEKLSEPRWPLYRVWADYNNRLTLWLSGGKHVCPVALIYCGLSVHLGRTVYPEPMTTLLQDALYDCDWVPYDAVEKNMHIDGSTAKLHKEGYKVLIVPPVEVIPYPVLKKAKEFFDQGGVVIGYEYLPSKSATLGYSSADIRELCDAIWGKEVCELKVKKTSPAGGQSYFLPPTSAMSVADIQQIVADASVKPTLEVLEGKTDNWLHILHRNKFNRDVFLVCNQNHLGTARKFKFRANVSGTPELWDAMRGEVKSIPFIQKGKHCDFELTLQPSESVLLVFQPKGSQRQLPTYPNNTLKPSLTIPVEGQIQAVHSATRQPFNFDGCKWIWSAEEDQFNRPNNEKRYFRKSIEIPDNQQITKALCVISVDGQYKVFLNGEQIFANGATFMPWVSPQILGLSSRLKPGKNTLAIEAWSDKIWNPRHIIAPAVLGKIHIEYTDDSTDLFCTDHSWKVFDKAQNNWQSLSFNDKKWTSAKEIAHIGDAPYEVLTREYMRPATPLTGTFEIPADIDVSQYAVYLEMDEPVSSAAAVTINNTYAGGFIGAPFRLNITDKIRTGANRIEIAPFGSDNVKLVFYKLGSPETP